MGRFDLIFLDVKVIQVKIKSEGGLKHASQKLILAKILNKGPCAGGGRLFEGARLFEGGACSIIFPIE